MPWSENCSAHLDEIRDAVALQNRAKETLKTAETYDKEINHLLTRMVQRHKVLPKYLHSRRLVNF